MRPERALGVELLGEHGDRPRARHSRVDPSGERHHEDGIAQARPGVDVEQRSHGTTVGSLA